MSIILTAAKDANLVVSSAKVDDINPVIFKTKVIDTLNNLTKDGNKYYRINVRDNSAVEINAESVNKGATKALDKGKDPQGYLDLAEDYGLIKKISLSRSSKDVVSDNSFGLSILAIADELDMKITDVTIDEQNEIIFKNHGMKRIENLTSDSGKHYQLDVKRNTATLINPKSVAKQAKKDLLAGDHDTDFVNIVDGFNLISSITFEAK